MNDKHGSPNTISISDPVNHLVTGEESIAVIDDSPEIVVLLTHYLKKQRFRVCSAGSSSGLYKLLAEKKIALVLLDIGLPDKNGDEVLPDLIESHPDLSIIMVTGTTDLDTALACLRHGADDYLTKPVNPELFLHTVNVTLKKRRLAINNRLYQEQLQKANSRMQFLHQLNLKMNSAYLNTGELDGILQAILVGITSDDGLKFNRAFMALFNEDCSYLEGRLAIGPSSREEAGKVWQAIEADGLQLDDILEIIQNKKIKEDLIVNNIVKTLRIQADNHDHILIASCRNKKSIKVIDGMAGDDTVPQSLLKVLGEDSFAIVPLYSPSQSLGVIIVDNFVTRTPITDQDMSDLEIFASQASLAIEHSHLHEGMVRKIAELEQVTEELEKNKDLLVEAERSSAIGMMAAQLVHAIRNPLTSIGATSRLLAKKTSDSYIVRFLNIITKETAKIESTLEDLFSIVESREYTLQKTSLYPLIRKSVMAFYATMKRNSITYSLNLDGKGPTLFLNERRIRQAFLHLIRNSIEAMAGGGILEIEVQEEEKTVVIKILDSGTGISTDTVNHVKDPFFTTKAFGNGMGLTLVDRIIQEHGGDFIIRDAKTGGTEVMITLPKSSGNHSVSS